MPRANRAFGGIVSLALILMPAVGNAAPGENTRVSIGDAALPRIANGASSTTGGGSLATNAATLVFSSEASTLVSGDTNGHADIFIYDRFAPGVYRISLGIGGAEADGPSSDPRVSHRVLGDQDVAGADGRFVAYTSAASNLVPADTNAVDDVFLFDEASRTTTLVSRATGADGVIGNGPSSRASPSHYGRFVVFQSAASNLVPDDTNGVPDIFLRDLEAQTTVRVSVAWASGGAQANGGSDSPVISADGRYVAFASAADNLVPGDTNGESDVFVFDRQTQTLTLASRASGANGTIGNGYSGLPALTADGLAVVFESSATNLGPVVPDGVSQIYGRDLETHTTFLLSRASGPDGAAGNLSSEQPTIAADGGRIVFESFANNLVPGDTNDSVDVFAYHFDTQTTTLISRAAGSSGAVGSAGGYSPAISGDGNWVTYTSESTNLVAADTNGSIADVFLRDLQSQTVALASVAVGATGGEGNGNSSETRISTDGRYVAFTSGAYNLIPDDTNGFADVFVYDRQDLTTTRVSVASDGAEGNESSDRSTISADGRYVAFQSLARNLAAGDDNGAPDIFVRDRLTNSTTLVSRTAAGGVGNGPSTAPAISDSGRYVAFISAASNLVAGDTNGHPDVFVYDRDTQAMQLVSRASGPDGVLGDRTSDIRRLAISADGRYVAFGSDATNLVPGDTNNTSDIFLYDRQSLTTIVVSRASGPNGVQGNRDSWYPQMSADGRYIVYRSRANNLVPGDTNNALDVFLYDRDLQTTTLVSRASGTTGAQGNGLSTFPSISADGRRILFFSGASNLVPGDTNGRSDWYMRDLQTQMVALVSRAYDGGFTAGDDGGNFADVNGDGQLATFSTGLANIVVGDTNNRSDVFVWEAVAFRDSVPPIITAMPVGPLGGNGWYVGDVSLTWTVSDPESVISSTDGCGPSSVITDTTGVVFSCSATSEGGTTNASITIKRDATLPLASALRAPLPNALGWNDGPVTVSFFGEDFTSGVANCAGSQTLTLDGAGQSAAGSCTDNAGNVSAPATINGINIDQADPAVTAARSPATGNAAGWNNTAVTVSFSGTDALSGVPVDGCTAPIARTSDGAGQSATGQCLDRAGNTGSATLGGINVDRTPPVAVAVVSPAPNGAGWNRSDVNVSFSGTDPMSGSGVAGCSASVPVTQETSGQPMSGDCTDLADNVSTSASVTVKLDKTAPGVSLTTPQAGASYAQGATVAAAYSCSDGRSGIATCAGPVANGAPIDTGTAGAKAFAVTATDVAGNSATVQVVYTVAAPGPVAPVIPNQSATEGVSFQFTAPQFTDPSGQGLTYVYSGLPGWLTVPYPAQNPRYLSGRPPYSESTASANRSYTVTLTATDSSAATARASFTLTVLNANATPAAPASIPAQTATEGVRLYGAAVQRPRRRRLDLHVLGSAVVAHGAVSDPEPALHRGQGAIHDLERDQ